MTFVQFWCKFSASAQLKYRFIRCNCLCTLELQLFVADNRNLAATSSQKNYDAFLSKQTNIIYLKTRHWWCTHQLVLELSVFALGVARQSLVYKHFVLRTSTAKKTTASRFKCRLQLSSFFWNLKHFACLIVVVWYTLYLRQKVDMRCRVFLRLTKLFHCHP